MQTTFEINPGYRLDLQVAMFQILSGRPPVDPGRVCDACLSRQHLTEVEEAINLPEVLIIYVNRKLDPAVLLTETPIHETLAIPVGDGSSMEEYTLNGVTLHPCDFLEDPSLFPHVWSAVRSRNGNLTCLNDENRHFLKSWAYLDEAQRVPPIGGRHMPTTFVYTRKHTQHMALSTRSRRLGRFTSISSTMDQTPVRQRQGRSVRTLLREASDNFGTQWPAGSEKLVKEMQAALPHIAPETIIGILIKHNGDIQATMHELIFTPDGTPDLSLNELRDSVLRPEMLKLHAEFPTVRIQLLRDLLLHHRGDHEATRTELLRQPKVALGFAETVGDAKIQMRLVVEPSDAPCDHTPAGNDRDLQVQRLEGQYLYMLHGKAWYAEFFGRARLLTTPEI